MPLVFFVAFVMGGFFMSLVLNERHVEDISLKSIEEVIEVCQQSLPRDQRCGAKIVTFVKEKTEEKNEEKNEEGKDE